MGTNALEVDFLCSGILGTNNRPLAFGKVYCYDAGTSNLNALYSDAAKGGRTANPIILDDRGSATGYGDGYYKFVYKDKNGVTIATYDNMYYVVPQTDIVTVRSISTSGLFTASTPEMIEVNTAGGAITLNLVTSVNHGGLEFIIVKTNAGGSTLTVTPFAGDTVGGAGTKDMTGTGEVLNIMSNNSTNWIVVNAPSGSAITTTSTDSLSNKTLTTPIIASFYQDAGKTKLMTTPNTASDTLAAIAATQTLTNKTLTAPTITAATITGASSITGLTEIYTAAWNNWGSSDSVTGLTSITTNNFWYKKIGKLVIADIYIYGTSNSTSFSVTLPFNIAAGILHGTACTGWDSGSQLAVPAKAILDYNFPTSVYFYKDWANSAWTNSGYKGIQCQIVYEATS